MSKCKECKEKVICVDCECNLCERTMVFESGGKKNGEMCEIISHYVLEGDHLCGICMRKKWNAKIA